MQRKVQLLSLADIQAMKIGRQDTYNHSGLPGDVHVSAYGRRIAVEVRQPETVIQNHRPASRWTAGHIITGCQKPAQHGPDTQHGKCISCNQISTDRAEGSLVIRHSYHAAAPARHFRYSAQPLLEHFHHWPELDGEELGHVRASVTDGHQLIGAPHGQRTEHRIVYYRKDGAV